MSNWEKAEFKKEGPFSEFEIIVERKNGDLFEGCAFEKDYKELTDTISNGTFLKFMIFKDNAFPIIHIRKAKQACENHNRKSQSVRGYQSIS